jgi:E3 Ubiquitin ligase
MSTTNSGDGGLIAAAFGAAIGLAFMYFGHAKDKEARALAGLEVEKISTVLHRATAGGDAGVAAIRGLVVIPPNVQPVEVQGVSPNDKIAIAEETVLLRKMAVVNGKLEEKSELLETRKKQAEWLVQDETASAVLTEAFKPTLETGPSRYEPVQAGYSPELSISRDGALKIKDKRERERVVGIEVIPRLLKAGTALTVIGRATVDGGVLRFHVSASSPFGPIADSRTLGQLIDDAKSSVGSLKTAGWICLGGTAAYLVYRAVTGGSTKQEAPTRRSVDNSSASEEDPGRPSNH